MIEETPIRSRVVEYSRRIDRGRKELAAVCLTDVLDDGLSMVYSFYDPDDTAASLGTQVILDHIQIAKDAGLPYVYLGYWVPGSSKMGYKAKFSALEIYVGGQWQDIGTIVCDEDEIVESQVVSGIAYQKDEAKVTMLKVAVKQGVAARIFGPLADANINVDMIVQNVASDGKSTDMTFTVQAAELSRTLDVLKAAEADIGSFEVTSSADVAKISVIGIGMRSHAGVAAQMFKALADKGINILAISTSEIKISVLIDAAYAELAVRTLHSMYGLDGS